MFFQPPSIDTLSVELQLLPRAWTCHGGTCQLKTLIGNCYTQLRRKLKLLWTGRESWLSGIVQFQEKKSRSLPSGEVGGFET